MNGTPPGADAPALPADLERIHSLVLACLDDASHIDAAWRGLDAIHEALERACPVPLMQPGGDVPSAHHGILAWVATGRPVSADPWCGEPRRLDRSELVALAIEEIAKVAGWRRRGEHLEPFEVNTSCPVELHGEGRPLLVLGRPVPAVTGGIYRVLESLVNAFTEGREVPRKELGELSGLKDPRAALRDLEPRELWERVLGTSGGRRGSPARHFLRWPA